MLDRVKAVRIRTISTLVAALLLVVGAAVVATSLVTLNELDRISQTWERFENDAANKAAILNDLRGALGYGGMIHQFKNFVLRKDRLRVVDIQSNLLRVVVALTAYRTLDLSATEKAALSELNRVLTEYADAVAVAERMASVGATSAEIDAAVMIDDRPALAALAVLNDEMQATHKTGEQMVGKSVSRAKDVVSLSTPVIAALLAILILSFFWFTRSRLLKPMAQLAKAMERLAEGDEETEIPWVERGDEFGGMASSVQVFKESMAENKRLEKQRRQSQKMEAVGQLTGGVAHDFNNLLTVVQGNLEFLAEDESDARKRKCINAASIAASRGAELTQRLLAFSRQASLSPRGIDPRRLLSGLTDMLRRTLDASIAIESDVGGGQWWPLADPNQLENALLNLALNARDAMPDGGTLTFAVDNMTLDEHAAAKKRGAKPGDYVTVSISDNGVGMAPSILERVFDPFFTTKEVGEGSGLGLSMVYGFVKQSNGYLELDSEVGRGTTVTLYLPRADETPSAGERRGEPKLQPHGKGETILVVEDDPAVRELVVGMLTGLGYRTIEAEDGKSALDIIDARPDIALLFTDVVLPRGLSGPEIAREARRRRPGLNVIFTSGYMKRETGRADGFGESHVLIQKPYRKADLARQLNAALEH